ncbi:uncharacterized protein [Macrobrachium rosenbergii]|uniref:uncharacterized protein isoform X2 n=1 Tax=Macrobrachium rosenbergii TaxID=79674 RepID=UPI0034D401A6
MGFTRKSFVCIHLLMVLVPLLEAAYQARERYNEELHEKQPEICGHTSQEMNKGVLEKLRPSKCMEEFLKWDMSHLIMKNVAESAALKVMQTFLFTDVQENARIFLRSLADILFSPTGAEKLQSCIKRWQCGLGRIILAIPTGPEIIRFVTKNYFPRDLKSIADMLLKMVEDPVPCETIPCDLMMEVSSAKGET